jgi:hypothetical protein
VTPEGGFSYVAMKVKQGDCWISLADKYGLPLESLQQKNSEIHRQRTDPSILCPGDEITIPEIDLTPEAVATEQKHRFKLTAKPVVLRLHLLAEGEPRGGVAYQLNIDGLMHVEGQSDGDGFVEERIPRSAKKGKLVLTEIDETMGLQFGAVDSPDANAGIQGRLFQLGFYDGEIDGVLGPKSKAAIRAFQRNREALEVDGIAGPQTQDELKKAFGH